MKKQQRSKAKAECASSAERNTTWKSIDFSKCERKVRKLQIRIAKAQKEKRYNKVKALQHLLVTSFEAKALAVRKVTSNKGKRTAGVDRIKWDTDASKIEAIRSLTRRGYKALPLKRVNIPKAKNTLLEIKEMLTAFLKERGLTLSEEKTLITHISEGFDFLGFNVRKYNGTLLIKPSKKSQKRFTDKLHEVVLTKGKALSQQELIEKLNPIIMGWGNYYSHVVSKEVFCRCDHNIINQLKRWSYRRHTKKSREWIRRKYFIHEGSRKWNFGFEYVCGGIKEKFTLQQLTEIPIKRHIKIKCEANPFDPLWDEYFERRKLKSARQRA